ncbi:MAG: substrate-binding and vWA domain-containing protein [Stackebrandtia sp.]
MISTVITLVASGMVIGYVWLLGSGCSGTPIKATLVTASSMQRTLSNLASTWERTSPDVGGQCVGVSVREKPSVEVASRLGHGWDDRTDGARPHIWVPESTAWLEMAKVGDNGAAMIPERTPLIASTPTVIAMPEPAAAALGWNGGDGEPEVEPTWADLVTLAEESTWADYGEDEWGDITLGVSSPRQTTAGMHALLSLVTSESDGKVSADALDNAVRLKNASKEVTSDVDGLLEGVRDADAEGDAMDYVSAFPALERDVYRYNVNMKGDDSLVAVYPSDGSIDADHPYSVLQNAEWTSDTYQEIGEKFGEFLTSDEAQQMFIDDGFRDGTRRQGGDELNNTPGLVPQIEQPKQEPPKPEAVNNTVTTWQALTRPTNVLIAVDTSESMAAEQSLDGEDLTRLEIVQRKLGEALNLFGDQANVGLSQFSDGYDEILPMDEYTSDYKSEMQDAVESLEPGGGRALHDASVGAYDELMSNYDEDAVNLVVVISDGADDASDRDLEETESDLAALNEGDPRAAIVTVGFGEDADADSMEAIAASTTRGQYLPAKWGDELDMQLLNALYNVV